MHWEQQLNINSSYGLSRSSFRSSSSTLIVWAGQQGTSSHFFCPLSTVIWLLLELLLTIVAAFELESCKQVPNWKSLSLRTVESQKIFGRQSLCWTWRDIEKFIWNIADSPALKRYTNFQIPYRLKILNSNKNLIPEQNMFIGNKVISTRIHN